MELAMLVGMSGTAAAGAGTAAAAAGGAAAAGSAAAASGGFLSTLSTGLTMASMASSLFGGLSAGKEQARAAELEAKGAKLDAKQQELQGKENANSILDNMIQTVAMQRLQFSAANVDPSIGTAASLADNARNLAELQLGTSRANTRNAVLARRRGAAATRMEGATTGRRTAMQGITSAAGTLGDFISRRSTRG